MDIVADTVAVARFPAWLEMWLLAIGMYGTLKLASWYYGGGTPQPLARLAAYLIAWPGMNARAFFAEHDSKQSPPPLTEWLGAIAKLALGIGLLAIAALWISRDYVLCRGWLGMTGIGFVLHFGLFHVLSCAWRALGVQAEPLMHWPIAATSVSDFWSQRWNTAFRDLTRQFVFRPLAPRIGGLAALWVGFLISGIVHDMVISIPARAGYGGPTLFFLAQAAAITLERSGWGKHWRLTGGVRGWCYTAAWLIVPAPLLFHAPFLRSVISPFLDHIANLGANLTF